LQRKRSFIAKGRGILFKLFMVKTTESTQKEGSLYLPSSLFTHAAFNVLAKEIQ